MRQNPIDNQNDHSLLHRVQHPQKMRIKFEQCSLRCRLAPDVRTMAPHDVCTRTGLHSDCSCFRAADGADAAVRRRRRSRLAIAVGGCCARVAFRPSEPIDHIRADDEKGLVCTWLIDVFMNYHFDFYDKILYFFIIFMGFMNVRLLVLFIHLKRRRLFHVMLKKRHFIKGENSWRSFKD